MQGYVHRWGFNSIDDMFTFTHHISNTNGSFVNDNSYEWRTRIHALNVLRLVILDAPLAKDMRKFIGDSLVSALIGYSDESWVVRNSSTMAFAAVMLRVIDADKNAGGKVKGIRPKVSKIEH